MSASLLYETILMFFRQFVCVCVVLYYHILGNESFLIAVYLLHWSVGPFIPLTTIGIFKFIGYFCFPLFCAKQFMNVVQLIDAASEVAAIDDPDKVSDAAVIDDPDKTH